MLAILKSVYQVFRIIREFVLSLFFILFVLVCFAFVSFLQSDSKTSKPAVPFSQGALMLNLDGYLADNHDEFGDFQRFLRSELGGTSEPIKISTFDVVRAIKKAREDNKITGLVLDLGQFEGGDLSSLHFVGEEIQRFKQSNKPVIAVGEHYTQSQYFLASFADQIYLNKSGFVGLQGLQYSNLYFKSLFDKIEAVPHIFRVGTYKSAVEPFLRDDMSPEARQNASLWLNKMWQYFSQTVANNRNINAEDVVPTFETYLAKYKQAKGDDAQYALSQGLVSALLTNKQMHEKLVAQFGENREGNYNHIDFFDYANTLTDRFQVQSANKIAVLNVEGAIVWGESDDQAAGSDTLVKLLHQAREDDDIKGVVLRINSPGGSAMASELIRQELEELQKAGKPVVASMGGMAASGGYWIAATSDKIIASPTTLTGSIGIFGLAMSFEKTAKNLGISQDGIETSPLARPAGLKTLAKEQAEIIQISIENGYDRFLELVARGRQMSKADVDKVAQGQVWLGETAFEKGLVDQLGDFYDAYIALGDLINAKRQAEGEPVIEQFSAQWLIEEETDFFSQLLNDFKRKTQAMAMAWLDLPLATPLVNATEQLKQFNDPTQTYLYCLNCGQVK